MGAEDQNENITEGLKDKNQTELIYGLGQ